MRITLLTNKKEYPFHSQLADIVSNELSSNGHTPVTIDVSINHHSIFKNIQDTDADVIISFDLSGFCLRTQSGECSLNSLFSKQLHIIWGDKPEYQKWLNGKLSLSMIFYDASGTNNELGKKYSNLLYYHFGNDCTSENWNNIWDIFLNEIS